MTRERNSRHPLRSALLWALVPALWLALGFSATALEARTGDTTSDRPARRLKKSIVINQNTQMLYAYEGGRLVLSGPVSTGRNYATPNGSFSVQNKEPMHYSRLFDNAPMPFSLYLQSNYFIHGFSDVPDYPASHGCIRVPESFARVLYNWASPGTSVVVKGRWESLRVPIRISANDTRRAVRAQPSDLGFAPPASTAQYTPTLRPVSVTR